jgi:hypothetical protein
LVLKEGLGAVYYFVVFSSGVQIPFGMIEMNDWKIGKDMRNE